MLRKVIISLAAVAFAGVMTASTTADARMGGGGHGGGFGGGFHGGGGFRGGMGGGGFRGGMMGGGFRGAAFRGGMMGGGFRGAAFRGGMMGGGFRGAAFRGGMMGGGFRGAAFRGGFVGPRNFALRQGFGPRFNRFAVAPRFNRFARFNRFHRRRFAFAAVPFAVGVGLYGGSCWSWEPTPWGWQRVWACGYDYGYY